MRPIPSSILAAVLMLVTVGLTAPRASADTFTVNSLDGTDDGSCDPSPNDCTIREAIDAANANFGTTDIIDFSVTGTIILTEFLPTVFDGVTITGPGAQDLTIDGSDSFGLFEIDTASGGENEYSISGLTLTGGVGTGLGLALGGGINVTSGEVVTLDDVAIMGNSANLGGGIYNVGDLTVSNSIVSGNSAVADDASYGLGGGVMGSGTLRNVTVSGNEAYGGWDGGGIPGGVCDVTGGGGLYALGSFILKHVTVADNETTLGDGGGIYASPGGSAMLTHSIVARNSDNDDYCSGEYPDVAEEDAGSIDTNGYNVIGVNDGATTNFPAGTPNANDDHVGTLGSPIDPLSPATQGDWGGPTETIALPDGSIAIDLVPVATCNAVRDQRGADRPKDGDDDGTDGCDSGAYERACSDVSCRDVLPVELTAFTAVADDRGVTLRWQTATETNNAGFEIQSVSKNVEAAVRPPDTWQTLAFVEGQGTTVVPQQYRYRVESRAPGRYVFRLKQVDFDGAFEYSPAVEVTLELAERFVLEPAYPNPFNPRTTIRFAVQQAGPARVVLYDVLGRQQRVLYDGHPAPGQMQAVEIDGNRLPSGLYVVRLVGKGFAATQRVMLLK